MAKFEGDGAGGGGLVGAADLGLFGVHTAGIGNGDNSRSDTKVWVRDGRMQMVSKWKKVPKGIETLSTVYLTMARTEFGGGGSPLRPPRGARAMGVGAGAGGAVGECAVGGDGGGGGVGQRPAAPTAR